MTTPEKDHLVVRYWPLIAMFITGLIGFGTLQARVNDLTDKAQVAAADHDTITTVAANLSNMQKQMDRVEGKIDRLNPSDAHR